MNSLKVLLAGVVALALPASANDGDSPLRGIQDVLVIAKMTGACGILDSLIQFQAATKMPGGDEFIARFWSVEAARLGWSAEEMMEKCKFSVSTYDTIWSVSEE